MREPAATVIDPAFTSPTMTPALLHIDPLGRLDVSLQFAADHDDAGQHLAGQMSARLDIEITSIRTSPLKRPAMRTFPDPSILPSMVKFAAMTDSPALDGGFRRRAARRDGQRRITDIALRRNSFRRRRRGGNWARGGGHRFFVPKRHDVNLPLMW